MAAKPVNPLPDSPPADQCDPLGQKILVIKSTNHFYAAFSKIASQIIYCSAGKPYPNDPATTPYRHVRRDIWPRNAAPAGDRE